MNSENIYKEMAGIIGGMGTEATNYFTSLLLQLRLPYVTKDQDHIPYIAFNNPQIPDRTEYLLGKSDVNPLGEMIKTGRALKNAGATFLVMTCNTAHAFAHHIEKEVGLPLVNIVEETVSYVRRVHGDKVTVGVLGTTGTIESQLYQQAFAKAADNITVLIPDQDEQTKIHEAIYSIKSSSVNQGNTQVLYDAAHKLFARGASVIILGCTEIPVALKTEKCKFFRVDPMEVLAQKVIERTLNNIVTYDKMPAQLPHNV